jgi:hypothetical protein
MDFFSMQDAERFITRVYLTITAAGITASIGAGAWLLFT